ncbi:MAG TPA: hypothetical protein VHR66_33110 [Gemmataceae bacterium]|nr:hypothetical protein [Gemmataceae bacterium]
MKLTVLKPTEIRAAAIRIVARLSRGETWIPKDFPFRTGDVWDVIVDGDTGRIRDWPGRVPTQCYVKISDRGSYFLLGPGGEVLASILKDYVPDCVPNDYGKFLDFSIDSDGRIAGWGDYWTAKNIRANFFPADAHAALEAAEALEADEAMWGPTIAAAATPFTDASSDF